MANSLGTLAPSLVAQRTLDYLKEMFPPVVRLFIDFTPQQVKLNQSITTRIPGVSAAYDASSGYVAKDASDTDVAVTATNFKAASIGFSTTELSSTDRDLVNEHAAGLANELGKDLLDQFCALFVNANYPLATYGTEEDAANYDDDTLRALRKKLNNRNVPNFGRLGIVNSDAFEALSGDNLVTTLDSNRNAHDDYQFTPPRLRARGFEILEYPQLPANSIDLNGVFLAPGACIGAVGIPTDANAAGMFPEAPNVANVTPVTDPDTGLTLLHRLHKTSNGGIQMDLAWIYGFAKGNPVCGELVQDAQS